MPLFAIEHAIETENFEKSTLILGEKVETMWKNGQHAAIIKYGDFFLMKSLKRMRILAYTTHVY